MIVKPTKSQTRRLVAFVGPSGSGKDTLMVKSRDYLLSAGIDVHIVQRSITRTMDQTEGFFSVSDEEFNECVDNNKFAIHWEIYGNKYGLPKEEIDPYLVSNIVVLVNVSRASLNQLREQYPLSKLVVIDVSTKMAEERIKIRKRDTGKNLEARLNRLNQIIDIPLPDLIIKNEDRSFKLTLSILMEFLKALNY